MDITYVACNPERTSYILHWMYYTHADNIYCIQYEHTKPIA